MQTMPKYIFYPVNDSSSLYAAGVTRGQGAVLLRRIGARGHFQSRDKDGGQTIRSAMAEKPLRKLHGSIFYRLKFYTAEIGNFTYFCDK